MKNIITIGGGTGSFILLSGLKKYPVNIEAIVSMADDGGSTGRLRDELGVLPPGDARQCLVALSDESEKIRELFNYRFESGDLAGHNFGNLFLSALEKIEGSFFKGINEAAKILNIKGKVIPVSEEKMNLRIKLQNGKTLVGENQLDHSKEVRRYGIEKVYLKPKVSTCKKAIEAIRNADLIVIGPGDLYGTILPNLLVKGIPKAIRKSKAKVIYNCNLTNKKGQTENFNLDDYVKFIERYIGEKRINFAIIPVAKPPWNLIKKYEKKEGKGSVINFDDIKNKKRNYKIIKARVSGTVHLVQNKNDKIAGTRSFIRHDSDKLAKVLMEILEMDNESLIKEII